MSSIDPKGLAIWDVTDGFEVGAVAGIGGRYVVYTLKSSCNSDGFRYIITVQAAGVSAGAGVGCKHCFTAPGNVPIGGQFNDHSPEPNPNVFNGGYLSVNTSAQLLGFGGSYGDTVLGLATDLRSINPSIGFGTIGVEIAGTIGTSAVTNVQTEPCDCKR